MKIISKNEKYFVEGNTNLVHAKWIWVEEDGVRYKVCSYCDTEAALKYNGKIVFTRFCPCCGAKMENTL